MSDIRPRDVSNFVDACLKKDDSPSTINHRLAILGKLWKFAIHHWEIPGVKQIDWSHYRQRNPYAGRTREITPAEQRKMLGLLASFENQGSAQMAQAVQLAIWTGIRQGELLALEVNNFQTDFNRLYIQQSYGSKTTKTGRARYIPVRGDALSLVKDLVASAKAKRRSRLFHELDKERIKALWRKMRTAMHLENDTEFVFHALRHTSATRLTRMGVSTRLVQEWLGHADIKTTQRYTHLASNDLDQLAELMARDVA
ncbi:site-specific integrase [Marinobacter salarius]|uniref:tyrosine-type recombinase/integrase n=1 Tax=Marinobacter salarius TaxID=1420917 RepID=UPI00273C423D|nr:site-specific integrase [Marinobacter salarius]MDP4532514.1 site-specific integrase [Marinobacter salarius]